MSKKLKVMLVDDNEIDLFIATEFIRKHGITEEIIVCRSSREGLSYLLETPENQWPDLILLDVQMPLMTGFDFLDQFKTIQPDSLGGPAIVMVSSTLDFGDIAMAKANSAVLDILPKPLKVTDLITLLESNEVL